MNNKVLIIGLGQIGLQYDLDLDWDKFTYTHACAFSKHKEFDLLAAVDSNKEQRNLFSKSYDLPTYSNLSEALKNHSPDVIVIATSTQTHAEILAEILDLFTPKVILCEKPLSYRLHEAKEMIDLCKSKDVDMYVNYMRRSDTGVIKIKRLLESADIKTKVKGLCWYSKGFIHNGSHFFNLLEFWLGKMKQFNLINTNKDRTSDDDYEPDVEVEFEKGRVVFLSAWGEFFSHHTIELLSSIGRIRYDENATMCFQDVINDSVFKDYKVLNTKSENITNNMQHSQLNVVNQLAEHLKGNTSHLCSGEEALNTLTAIQLIIDRINKNE